MTTTRPVTPSGRRPYLAVPAYSGRAKDTSLDAYGSHRGVHPTDQGMAMALMVRRGTVASDPEVGNALHTITDLSAPDIDEQIRSVVNAAHPLARLVTEGKVTIERIDHQVARGKLAVVVYYKNTDTGERMPVGWYT